MVFINILIFIVILLVLVLVHEFGHFIVAKKAGIRVDEFAFGMKPRIFSIKRGETEYSLNALPIGGYVSIYGENPDEESMNGPDSSRSFVNKPKYIQAAVLFAGVFMNLLLGWFLIIGLYAFGTHVIFDDTLPARFLNNTHVVISAVSKNSPAERAVMEAGDVVSEISYFDNSKTLETYNTASVTKFIRESDGKQIRFEVLRNQIPVTLIVTPEKSGDHYVIGVAPTLQGYVKLPLGDAIIQGFRSSGILVKETFKGFWGLISGKQSVGDASGPVGMVSIVGVAVKLGTDYLFFFIALISFNLAVINLIPFPALDGGRLLFLLIEKIKGSRIKPQVANTVNSIGFALLMILMVVITYNDIAKLF